MRFASGDGATIGSAIITFGSGFGSTTVGDCSSRRGATSWETAGASLAGDRSPSKSVENAKLVSRCGEFSRTGAGDTSGVLTVDSGDTSTASCTSWLPVEGDASVVTS